MDALTAAANLSALEKKLSPRATEAEKHLEYYRGDQKLRFASDQFRFYFAKRYVDFSDNWCGIVAESPTERLEIQGIRLPGSGDETSESPGVRKGDDDLFRVWGTNDMEAQSGMGFLHSISTSRAFGLVWGNPDDESTPEMSFEDSRECIVEYVPGSRRTRQAGATVWSDDKYDYGTLYEPNAVWKFRRRTQTHRDDSASNLIVVSRTATAGGWEPYQPPSDDVWPVPNPLNAVPLVELENRPLLGEQPISDIGGVMAMQDAVNLLWSQLFTASDYAALGQRIILGAEVPKLPILNDQGEVVGERPVDMQTLREKRILWVPDKDADVKEWAAADLEAYTKVIDIAIGHIAAQTRTPQHYLVGKMANLSADALKAAETGLVKKTQEKQLYLGRGVREMFRLAALCQDEPAKARQVASATVLWKDAEMRSEAQLVDALTKLRTIGFPFQWIAERYGLTPTEVTRVIDLKQAEQDSALFSQLMSGPAEPPTPPAPVEDTPPAA